MAFQNDPSLVAFLRGAARSPIVAEAAPATNFLLEERLSAPREQAFAAARSASVPWDIPGWWQTFGNHYNDQVALPLRRAGNISTFGAENSDNHLVIESHQDVVRLESLAALHRHFPGSFDSAAELAAELRNLIQSREAGNASTVTEEQRSRLVEWLDGAEPGGQGGLNGKRDARPAFAAPYDEVEALLAKPDWATQLRNVLGLAHFAGSTAKPLPVVLCRYNLSRVERAARKARVANWAAIPTVLEAGNGNGPGAAFFPFPKAAASSVFGFGVTIDLTPEGGLDFKSELVHFRLDYTLDDLVAVGEITDQVTDAQLDTYRRRHFSLLEQELRFRSDVPKP